MSIAVISVESRFEKAKNMITSQPFYDQYEEILLISNVDDGYSPKQFRMVIVDTDSIDIAVRLYRTESYTKNLYILADNTVTSAGNTQFFQEPLAKAIDNKDWALVKRINSLMVKMNYILKEECLQTYPTQLQIESTSFCNARCIMCSHYYAGNSGALDMSERMLDRLSELLPYLKVIIMHGNGEPFASKLFEKCVDTYSSYGILLTSSTNLSIFNEKQIARANQAFVDIRVSCDACTKEIYEGIRTNLSFDRFVENCVKLRDRCPNVHKVMASVMMRQNLEQLPEMVEFAYEYGFSEIIFSNLGVSMLVGNEMDNVSHYPYLAAAQLRKAIDTGKNLGIIVTIPTSFDLSLQNDEICERERAQVHATPFFKSAEEVERIREKASQYGGENMRLIENLEDCIWEDDLYDCEGVCEWCIEKPFIDLEGNVFVCCINPTFRIGNIFESDSFMDIWNNEQYRKIRRLFYSGKVPAFCNNCQFILNNTLNNLSVPSPDPGFFRRRHISKRCFEYKKEQVDE